MPARKRRFYDPDSDSQDYVPDYEDGFPSTAKAHASAEDQESPVRGPTRPQREMEERREDGAKLVAVLPQSARDLSRTFWGQAWNRNLQAYADQVSALTKGRTEYRKGRVMDLAVAPGEISAVVAGNRLWDVKIFAQQLDAESWAELRRACLGQITDVSDLLAGEVPPALLTQLSQPETGLFPHPSDLRGSCTCPDHARLCIHAAAVLYAYGTQLDDAPSKLFTLRGGAPQDLIAQLGEVMTDLTAGPEQDAARTAALEGQDLSDLFGMEIESL